MLSEIFYTFLITTSSGLLLALLTLFYKSKCRTVNFCGLIKIERDVITEQKEDELELGFNIREK